MSLDGDSSVNDNPSNNGNLGSNGHSGGKNEEVIIHTDGACSGNPGAGGWGVLLAYKDVEKELSGFVANTTNNQMELLAAINALKALKRKCSVTLYTDSIYLKNGITKWIFNWKRNNWKTSNKKPVKNVELWRELDKLVNFHDVKWVWVKAHAGHRGNEIADNLARTALVSNKNSVSKH